ncbi:18972_t:CDS:2, partial [Gigaspora rosea]
MSQSRQATQTQLSSSRNVSCNVFRIRHLSCSVERDRSVSPKYSKRRSRSPLRSQRSFDQNRLRDNDNVGLFHRGIHRDHYHVVDDLPIRINYMTIAIQIMRDFEGGSPHYDLAVSITNDEQYDEQHDNEVIREALPEPGPSQNSSAMLSQEENDNLFG